REAILLGPPKGKRVTTLLSRLSSQVPMTEGGPVVHDDPANTLQRALMTHICVIGAGITGVTTAYSLQQRGYKVTVLDRQCYLAMDTSFANGGQLSASNAEVWNS